jgi:hypothetical protein
MLLIFYVNALSSGGDHLALAARTSLVGPATLANLMAPPTSVNDLSEIIHNNELNRN